MKERIKLVASFIAHFLCLPLTLSYRLMLTLFEERAAFRPYAEFLSLIPGTVGSYLRRAFYQQTFAACAGDCFIGFLTIFASPRVRIGARAYIGAQCSFGEVTIGADTMIASGVRIVSGLAQHGTSELQTPMREQQGSYSAVTIGADCWLGEGAVVAADVGDHSIVAAGAVVVRPVPAYSVVAGNPATVVRSRREGLKGAQLV